MEKKLLTWHLFLLVPQVHRPVAVREPVPLCDVFGIAHVREHSVLLPEALLADEAEVHAPVTSIRLSSTDDQIRVVTQDCTNRPLDRLVELGSRELRRGRHGTRLGVSNVLQHFFFPESWTQHSSTREPRQREENVVCKRNTRTRDKIVAFQIQQTLTQRRGKNTNSWCDFQSRLIHVNATRHKTRGD